MKVIALILLLVLVGCGTTSPPPPTEPPPPTARLSPSVEVKAFFVVQEEGTGETTYIIPRELTAKEHELMIEMFGEGSYKTNKIMTFTPGIR